MFRRILCIALLLGLTCSCWGGELEINAPGKKAPFTLQGPFVSIANHGILAVEYGFVWRSFDEGKTWESHKILDLKKYKDRYERALFRTSKGVILCSFLNDVEHIPGPRGAEWGLYPPEKYYLPVYVIRSTDDGKTWSTPVKMEGNWCGAQRSMIELASGRLVLVGQKYVRTGTDPKAGLCNATFTYVSDDQGVTWKTSNVLEIAGQHDHDGAMEASIVEKKNGDVWMLIRTVKGTFYESTSKDGGLTWSEPVSSGIQNNNCCCVLTRLSDGCLALVWNHDPSLPAYHFTSETPWDNRPFRSREHLSIAFSTDDGENWTKPFILAKRMKTPGSRWGEDQVSYPYLYERHPGVFWVTSMFGDLRMVISKQEILDAIKKQ